MESKKYVINSHYDFGLVADGPRPHDTGETGILLQFEHDEVMEMGEYFHEEDPYEIDYDYNFGIKDKLDGILIEATIEELREEWEEEKESYSEEEFDDEEPDFEEMAYERIGDMYYTWDERFKQDCISYYLTHK